MNAWPIHDEQARFGELLNACFSDGPQMVARCGAEVAVLVPVAQWRRLRAADRPSLMELLLTDAERCELPLRPRVQASRRPSGRA